MIRRILLITALLSVAFIYFACETDVDIDAEWKEITIVYGLIDQRDTVHYFRINKAFLGGNALEIAQIEDSSSYRNNLEVVMEGWENGQKKQSITFDTTTIGNKDTGMWYNPYMVVYKGVGEINQDWIYKLFITNTVTGKEITAETGIIHDFSILKPIPGSRATFKKGFTFNFSWVNKEISVGHAMRYEPLIRFYYFEVPLGTTDTILKYIDWNQTTQYNLPGHNEVEIAVSGDAFYEVLEQKLDPDFEGIRLVDSVQYIVSAAGEEYDTYLKVNEPSSSLVQERPEYTNVVNGFGLMSSRYQKSRMHAMNPLTEDEILSMDLKFVESPYVGK